MFHGISPALHRFMRDEGIMTLQSKETLLTYTGSSKGEVGFTDLIIKRLKMEANNLPLQDRMVSLQVDEMQVRKALQYVKARQSFVGMVDLGGVDIENSKSARNDGGDDEANLDDDLEKDNVEDDLGNDLEKLE